MKNKYFLYCFLVLLLIFNANCGDGEDGSPPTGGSPLTGPDPYFSSTTSEKKHYDPFGNCIGTYSGAEIKNRGEPGSVFVNAVLENANKSYSEVFYMDQNETVKVWVLVKGLSLVPWSEHVKWTTRRALSGDTSDGNILVERQ